MPDFARSADRDYWEEGDFGFVDTRSAAVPLANLRIPLDWDTKLHWYLPSCCSALSPCCNYFACYPGPRYCRYYWANL